MLHCKVEKKIEILLNQIVEGTNTTKTMTDISVNQPEYVTEVQGQFTCYEDWLQANENLKNYFTETELKEMAPNFYAYSGEASTQMVAGEIKELSQCDPSSIFFLRPRDETEFKYFVINKRTCEYILQTCEAPPKLSRERATPEEELQTHICVEDYNAGNWMGYFKIHRDIYEDEELMKEHCRELVSSTFSTFSTFGKGGAKVEPK